MKLSPAQFEAITWHRYLGGPRPAGVPHISVADLGLAEFNRVLSWWSQFDRWMIWKDAGTGPRPAVWRLVPPLAWKLRKAILATRPHISPPPPPPPGPTPGPNPYAHLAENVMFTAWRPEDGLRADKPHQKIAVTADLNVAGNPQAHLEACKRTAIAAHSRGQLVAVWANQVEVSPDQMRWLAGQVGADYLIHQGETSWEYHTAIEAGATVIIGNPNSWTREQVADANKRIAMGQLAVIFETYTGDGAPWPEDSAANGVAVTSICPNVGNGKYPHQLPEYKLHTPPGQWATLCVYIAETMSGESWQILP